MKHRKVYERTHVVQTVGWDYTCDRCGVRMPEHNAGGGFLPSLEGASPRNKLMVTLNEENFSGGGDGNQQLSRDYCDECLPGIWRIITELLAYGESAGRFPLAGS